MAKIEISPGDKSQTEDDSIIDDLIKDVNQTILDSDIELENQTIEHEAGSDHNDASKMTDEELQDILSAIDASKEESPGLDELSYNESVITLDSNIETNPLHEEHDHIASTSVENIVLNILGSENDQDEEGLAPDVVEAINSDENNYSSTISELSTIVEGIESGADLFPDLLNEEKHEEIVARIESLWADLADVWPAIQNQPHVVEQIEELWKLLKQDGNESYAMPSEFDHLFQGTNTDNNDNVLDLASYRTPSDQATTSSKLTDSDTSYKLTDKPTFDESHKHVFKDGKLQTTFTPTIVDDKLGDLISDILGDEADSSEPAFQPVKETGLSEPVIDESLQHLFENVEFETTEPETNQPEITANALLVDNELGDLISNNLGINTEADEPRFHDTTPATGEKWSPSVANESITDESEPSINSTYASDEVNDLVSNLLGDNTEAGDVPILTNVETDSSTSGNETLDEVEAILKKYADDGESLPHAKTELEMQSSATTPSNDGFVVDDELQKILETTTKSQAAVSNASISDDTVSNTNGSNTNSTSAPTQTTSLKKAEPETRSTSRSPATLRGSVSKQTATTQRNKAYQGKTHTNETSGPDTTSSGWRWVFASIIPVAIIALIWAFLATDDAADQKTTANNMALYAQKTTASSSSPRNDETREESIEDIIKRMSETDATSPTETFDELNTTVEPVPENVRTEFSSEEFVPLPFNQASSNEMSSTAVDPTGGLSPGNEQHLQELTNHISRLEATITDLQQTATAQNAAVMQAQETANTLPVEQITQLIDAPVANLQQGVDQRFMELGARITWLENAVSKLKQSAQLAQQNAANENNATATLSQGNQQQINTLTQRLSEFESSLQNQAAKITSNETAQTLRQKELQQKILNGDKVTANKASIALSQGNQQQISTLTHRLSEIESSLQDQATKITNNESAQALQQKTLQEKILTGDFNGNKATANNASVALSQGNQQQIQSLTHRINKVESSLQNHATDISHTKIIMGNTTGADVKTGKGTDSGRASIEQDSGGVTITLNKPATEAEIQESLDNGKSQMIIHIVVKGDTLWAIAKRYVNNPFMYPELARLSNIKNPHLIYPGNRVRIIKYTN